jgi:hypothetical protein
MLGAIPLLGMLKVTLPVPALTANPEPATALNTPVLPMVLLLMEMPVPAVSEVCAPGKVCPDLKVIRPLPAIDSPVAAGEHAVPLQDWKSQTGVAPSASRRSVWDTPVLFDACRSSGNEGMLFPVAVTGSTVPAAVRGLVNVSVLVNVSGLEYVPLNCVPASEPLNWENAGCEQLAFPPAVIPVANKLDAHCVGGTANDVAVLAALAVAALPVTLIP